MNKRRREVLNEAIGFLNNVSGIISSAMYEEQDCLDNLPDGIQSSDRGTAMEDAISNLEDAVDAISSAVESIESAIGG